MSPTLVALVCCAPAVLVAALLALADLAPDTFGWIERAIARIPGIQWTWDRLYGAMKRLIG